MSLDLTTLRLLKRRDRYEKLARSVPKRALDTRTQIIFDDFGTYFKEHPDLQTIEPGPFMFWFKAFKHPDLKDEATAVITEMMNKVTEDVDPALEAGLIKRLSAAAAAFDLAVAIEKFNSGEEIDLRLAVTSITDAYDATVIRQVKNPQVLDPIEDLLKAEAENVGFHFRLPCLNRHMKPGRPGDFIVVAARPDKGKTTFISDNVTHMAPQVDQLYPGEGRSIMWFNNEGPGRNIVFRNFQSALNVTVEEMAALNLKPAKPENVERYRTALREGYAESLGGRPGVLRVFDIHGMWSHEVEELISKYTPAVVVFDMIDNIRFGGETANNGQRTDQLLETMYQWARMMAVKHDFLAIATSQISADGDGLQFPTLPMLKDSKTGKQGAADVIITLGTVNDQTLAKSRYIGMTKNKRARTGIASSPQMEVIFDGDRGRYVEIAN